MTLFYLVRHGETDWPAMRARGAQGREFNFAALTATGVAQIEALRGDARLKSAEAIIASPYTRAMQSTAILNRCLGLPVHVEYDLHEWVHDRDADTPFDPVEVERRRQHFYASDRFAPPEQSLDWETGFEVRTRAAAVLDRYRHVACGIVVCHLGVIFSLTGLTQVGLGEVVEYRWEP
jgi:broad specificity phosphatase PhoE